MIKVLFVCLGNICRSPMAEAMFRHKVKEAGLEHKIEVDSAGTGDWHIGKPPHHGTQDVLNNYQIDYTGMHARQIIPIDEQNFDYIIAMDDSNVSNIQAIFNNPKSEIKKMLEFAVKSYESSDVPDPYYTGNFEEVYEMLDDSCDQLLKYIREQKEI